MIGGSIQISGEELSSPEVLDICDSLHENAIKLLSLRGCKVEDKDFLRLMRAFGQCRSILQLNLNLGVVSNVARATHLANALNENRSLESLLLHGTNFGDGGLGLLVRSFSQHPSLISLDLGDCAITDDGVRMITTLLPRDGAKRGLVELTLSANTSITDIGWSHLFCAIAASSHLKVLNLDYNNIGDYVAGVFAAVVAGNRTLHTVDFEGCGITDKGATIIYEMLESFPTPLHQLILADNKVSDKLIVNIDNCLRVEEDTSSHLTPKSEQVVKEDWLPQHTRPILQERAQSSPADYVPSPTFY